MRTASACSVTLFLAVFGTACQSAVPKDMARGVTEVGEGTIRRLYVDKPLSGARGYVVGDWRSGDVRLEVMDFPASEIGYEVFLFELDVPSYMNMMFVDGDKEKGVVAELPPFEDVAGLISQWHRLGDLELDGDGTGRLVASGAGDLYAKGLNMVMVFEKETPGAHDAPENPANLIVECNGPLAGAPGSEDMAKALTVLSDT